MKNYKNILFDLDGTITDSGEGIINSVLYSLQKFGINEVDMEKIKKFIGPPLKESFGEFYGMTLLQKEEAVKYYREYYQEKGIYENKVYEGIENLLKNLKNEGKNVILATSKPQFYAEEILKYFKIDNLFDFVKGSNMDGSKTNKKEIIEEIISELGLKREETIMVGDRCYDITGAKACKIKSIGVLYGYGSREELEMEKADYIIENVGEIYNILKG